VTPKTKQAIFEALRRQGYRHARVGFSGELGHGTFERAVFTPDPDAHQDLDKAQGYDLFDLESDCEAALNTLHTARNWKHAEGSDGAFDLDVAAETVTLTLTLYYPSDEDDEDTVAVTHSYAL
jgi:hypothetical protein